MSSGEITWKSPSNIAIVKYWGKYGRQLPRNCSLSFTLSEAYTKTTLVYHQVNPSPMVKMDFFFEGQFNPAFGKKANTFLNSIVEDMPFLLEYKLEIHTENTFPHSSGIASSASGISALAASICHLEQLHRGEDFHDDDAFRRRVSYYSRLGSGSACRSVYPGLASWGVHPNIKGSSNEYATCVKGLVHPDFMNYHDDILIVSKKEKSVSSTAGHQLMEGNPYATPRYQQANDNTNRLLKALQANDQHLFGQVLEDEALTLHALMMCSSPSYILMEPNTIEMIKRIRAFRLETQHPVYFTLDAGPNIHLIYPDSIADTIDSWINTDLLPLTDNNMMIRDKVGQGSQLLK